MEPAWTEARREVCWNPSLKREGKTSAKKPGPGSSWSLSPRGCDLQMQAEQPTSGARPRRKPWQSRNRA